MLLVILGVTLVIAIVFAILDDKSYCDWACYVSGAAFIISLITLILLAVVFGGYSTSRVIDRKIAMYQEENECIEERIQVVVDDYMQYESNTFDKIKSEGDPITYVTLFPELKSNELVVKQIEVYEANNQQIKELRCEKLDHDVEAWWLFFGGGE